MILGSYNDSVMAHKRHSTCTSTYVLMYRTTGPGPQARSERAAISQAAQWVILFCSFLWFSPPRSFRQIQLDDYLPPSLPTDNPTDGGGVIGVILWHVVIVHDCQLRLKMYPSRYKKSWRRLHCQVASQSTTTPDSMARERSSSPYCSQKYSFAKDFSESY